jgi:hypothetical protein
VCIALTVHQIFFRPQDDEIHELSASVQRTGGGGLSIHDDLSRQVVATGRQAARLIDFHVVNLSENNVNCLIIISFMLAFPNSSGLLGIC